MNISLKVMLTAIGIAVLASPVMAQPASQPESNPHAATISNARGSIAHARARATQTERVAPVPTVRLDDCVHVQFPQCGGDATQTEFDRP
jgi:hypothetical protein